MKLKNYQPSKQKFIGTRTFPKLKFIPTHKIKEILDNDGISHKGNDYQVVLEELIELYNERIATQSDKELEKTLKMKEQEELDGMKVCNKCGTLYPLDQVASNFYKLPGSNGTKFRAKCKSCIKQENLITITMKRTNVPF
jgi:hypothetical protein